MADKTFHSIKFPGLPDTYKIPDIVNEYSTSSAYAVGDYVLKDGKTYKCTTAIASSGEAWNVAHWTEVKVGNDLQGEIADLKSTLGERVAIKKIAEGYYISLTTDPVDLNNPSVSSSGLTYSITNCAEGDQFIINAEGDTNGRAWGFLDNSNSVITMADSNATVTNLELTAPANAVKLVINDKSGSTSYKVGKNLINRVSALENDVNNIEEQIAEIEPGLSEEAKEALLACFEHVAWVDEHGPDYYEALVDAFDMQIDVLSVTFDSKNRTIYVDDTVDSIKYFLTVKWNDETVRVSDYTLSGILESGNNELTVTYNGKTAKVIVPAEEIKWSLSYANNDIQRFNGSANKWASDSSGYGGPTLNPNDITRTFVSPKGRHPYYLDNGSFQTDKYPIPVPKNATSVTITPAPNTYYTAINCEEYHPDRLSWQPYTVLSPEVGFGQGARTLQLPAAETAFGLRVINMLIRRTSGGSAYTDATNPTGCVVQFS